MIDVRNRILTWHLFHLCIKSEPKKFIQIDILCMTQACKHSYSTSQTVSDVLTFVIYIYTHTFSLSVCVDDWCVSMSALFAWVCGCGVCECDLWECLYVNWRAVVLRDHPFVSIWPSGWYLAATSNTHTHTHIQALTHSCKHTCDCCTNLALGFLQCSKVLTRHTWDILRRQQHC